MSLSTALRVAIESIEWRLKKQWTIEANMHDMLGLKQFEKESKFRRRYLEAKETLQDYLDEL